jgi:hypothetical protein
MTCGTLLAADTKPRSNVILDPIPGLDISTGQETLERYVSDHLVRADAKKSEALKKQMDMILGDLQRSLNLTPEKLRTLQIAANGAVHETLTGWRSAQENQVRQLTNGAGEENLTARLNGVAEIQLGNEIPHNKQIWATTLSHTLNPTEQQAWLALEAERADYRQKAVSALLLTELERKLSLSEAQSEKLEPLLQQAFTEYLPDMSNYIDCGSGMDIRMLLLLLNGVPEQEQRNILSKEQLEKWRGVTADYSGWWQNIIQNHQSRLSGSGNPNE